MEAHPADGVRQIELPVHPLSAEAFAPYGQVIAPSRDGKPFGPDDAQLDLGRGTPRFYILSLKARPAAFSAITRHLSVTQCLASVGGRPWLIAVAPPDAPDDPGARPDLGRLKAFRVPGNMGIKLDRGTWHAGPYFEGDGADFFNLELADTNTVDHFTCRLDQRFTFAA